MNRDFTPPHRHAGAPDRFRLCCRRRAPPNAIRPSPSLTTSKRNRHEIQHCYIAYRRTGGRVHRACSHRRSSRNFLRCCMRFPAPTDRRPTGMIQASDGNFYGATTTAATSRSACRRTAAARCSASICPASFKQLHVFHAKDGYYPSGLVEGPNGKLYGVTRLGGKKNERRRRALQHFTERQRLHDPSSFRRRLQLLRRRAAATGHGACQRRQVLRHDRIGGDFRDSRSSRLWHGVPLRSADECDHLHPFLPAVGWQRHFPERLSDPGQRRRHLRHGARRRLGRRRHAVEDQHRRKRIPGGDAASQPAKPIAAPFRARTAIFTAPTISVPAPSTR